MKYQPGRETEHNKTGTCVTEQVQLKHNFYQGDFDVNHSPGGGLLQSKVRRIMQVRLEVWLDKYKYKDKDRYEAVFKRIP